MGKKTNDKLGKKAIIVMPNDSPLVKVICPQKNLDVRVWMCKIGFLYVDPSSVVGEQSGGWRVLWLALPGTKVPVHNNARHSKAWI